MFDLNDFFSGSKPELVSNESVLNVEQMIKPIVNIEKNITPTESLTNFYENFIQPNIFFFIIIFLLALFLFYKYITKNMGLEENYRSLSKYNDIYDQHDINDNYKYY